MGTAQTAVAARVVIVGKVASAGGKPIETPDPWGPPAGPSDAPARPATRSVHYKVVTVAVEDALSGAACLKEVRVGVLVSNKDAKPAPDLKEGQRLLLFLAKHPFGDFYVPPGAINAIPGPVMLGTKDGDAALAEDRRALAVVAEPMKSLKAAKARDRVEAAVLLVMHYREGSDFGADDDEVPLPAEEEKLIVETLMGAEWKMHSGEVASTANPFRAYKLIQFWKHPGWKEPREEADVDWAAQAKEASAECVAGPGKGFRLTKLVPRPAGKK